MAALLMIWGLVLLRKNDGFRNDSKGWLMLAIPCPVCMIVILFSVGFLITLFPDAPGSVAVVFYLAFLLINLLTMGAIYFYRKTSTISPEYLLGGAMMLIAAYFFLSVTIIPQFDDVEKVYRLAMYKGRMQPAETLHLIPFSILIISAFIGGYGLKFKKIRSTIS
jgi:predicted transporter